MNTSRYFRKGAAILAFGLLAACATSGVQSSLERAQALSAAGQYGPAWQTLQRASADHPDNAELHNATLAARERYALQSFRRAESALNEGRWEEARSAYRELAAIPGQASKANEGLERVQHAQDASVVPTVRKLAAPAVLASTSVASSTSSASVAAVAGSTALPGPAANAVPSVFSTSPAQSSATTSELPQVFANASQASASSAMAVRERSTAAVRGNAMSAASLAAAAPAVQAPLASAPAPAPVVVEDPMARRVTLEFRDATVRSLFDVIGKASGLNVIFDREVSPDLRTTVYLRNTTVRSAIEKIVMTSGLAWRNLDENTLLVYMDDSNKQRDYQALTVRSFQLFNADAKFVANSLKTVLRFTNLVVDEKLNMIVVRDTPEAIAMAEKLVAMHDQSEPEVMLEVTVLEVSKGKLENLGVSWPTSMSLTPLARSASPVSSTSSGTTTSTTPLTLRDLWGLTPGSLGMTLGSDLALNFNATDNGLNLLANPRIRAKNKEKAKILIGERVPNISSNTTSTGVISQAITYIDVGLKLEVEPQIFPGDEISMKVNLEVSSITSTVENKTAGIVAYRIGTRNASTVLRLKDGENQILAGLIQDIDKKSVSKVPLLGDIPILGRLFRSDSTDDSKTEIVLSITPRLIRQNRTLDADTRSFNAGTQSSLRGRREGGEGGGSSIESSPQVQQPVQQIVVQPVSNGDGSRKFGGSSD
ncbi:secretin N-terminal domain-containing protein [Uliginosibacterium aquaticum]|uniref:General secretion pathway protein GspD n=1 Tax=Uliginosibacterium aquaticum TaxID=2731212 RepID=A0ABX2IRV7_9RHOO|nr:secretin N-terminal domain-containing protein [Uliginosibacterium aquaticum]NSL56725.1 general secretion pathway protein GspD [Uliginosibacterium aquaticum]